MPGPVTGIGAVGNPPTNTIGVAGNGLLAGGVGKAVHGTTDEQALVHCVRSWVGVT